MKKSRLFMACGTFILTAVAIFASKANKKFTTLGTVRIGNSSGKEVIMTSAATSVFTSVGSGKNPVQLAINISTSLGSLSGFSGDLVTKTSGTAPVYYK
jgi:hypothetical protein